MSVRKHYALCDDLGVSVTTTSHNSLLARGLSAVLDPFEVDERASRTLLEVAEWKPEPGHGFLAGRVHVTGSSVQVDAGQFGFELRLGERVPALLCRAAPPLPSVAPKAIRDRVIRGERTGGMRQALSYHGFWSILHLALLRFGRGFAHAGCLVDRSGSSHLITGAGGSGKTSTTLSLVERYGWRYQSEDFALLGLDGHSYLSPRPLTVYYSDVRWGSAVLTAYEASLPLIEGLLWHMAARLNRNPQRRVRFDRLFEPGQVAREPATLRSVHFIRRTTEVGVLEVEEITTPSMADHVLAASMRELFSLYEPMLQVQAALGPNTPETLRFESVFSATRSLYLDAFRGTECNLITASKEISPPRIAESIDGYG
jgi:hypothetical protein